MCGTGSPHVTAKSVLASVTPDAGALNLSIEVVHAAPLVRRQLPPCEIQQSAWFAAPRKKPFARR